jgi:hypothetical protein
MLTSLLLVVMSMAIDFHLRVAEKGRVEVEEGQLARTLLHMIANDLRNAVVPASGENTGSSDSSAGSMSGGGDILDGSETSSPAESVITTTPTGLYGSIDSLQVDVSRLPRLDQYITETDQLSAATPVDVTSAVKTVTYYLLAPGEGGTITTDEGVVDQSGLVRRELDRAVTAYADEQGSLDEAALETEPIAPEVVGIEFLYYNGTDWLEEWDSDTNGGLPLAVQVSLALAPFDRENDDELATWATSDFQQLVDEGVTPVYRLLVHLPNGKASSTTENSSSSLDLGEELP